MCRTFLLVNWFEHFLYMITQFTLRVMHYSLLNLVPISIHVRTPTRDETEKSEGGESWWLFSTPRSTGAFNSSSEFKYWPFKCSFIYGKRRKSEGTRSWLYDECRRTSLNCSHCSPCCVLRVLCRRALYFWRMGSKSLRTRHICAHIFPNLSK